MTLLVFSRSGFRRLHRPRTPALAVLTCSCGTWWTQRDIDEYNAGDPNRATERHLSLWKPDGKTHTVQRCEQHRQATEA